MTGQTHPGLARAIANSITEAYVLQHTAASFDGLRRRTLEPARLGGFPLTAQIERSLGEISVMLALDSAPGTDIRLPIRDLGEADAAGLVTRLENRLARLEERKADSIAAIERARREIDHARMSIGKPSPKPPSSPRPESAPARSTNSQKDGRPQQPNEQADSKTAPESPRCAGALARPTPQEPVSLPKAA